MQGTRIVEQTTAYVALGANVGDRERTIREAIRVLGERHDVTVTALSRIRETEPVGGPPQAPYLNAVAEVRTCLHASRLLEALQEIEDRFGRVRTVRWGPRTLDLDLLLYGGAVIDTPGLQVPHPRMHERRFVLEPLCEIAPDVRHPVLDQTAEQLLARLAGPQLGGSLNRPG